MISSFFRLFATILICSSMVRHASCKGPCWFVFCFSSGLPVLRASLPKLFYCVSSCVAPVPFTSRSRPVGRGSPKRPRGTLHVRGGASKTVDRLICSPPRLQRAREEGNAPMVTASGNMVRGEDLVWFVRIYARGHGSEQSPFRRPGR
jgi:hypothetical protein